MNMIDGVTIRSLSKFPDDRGGVSRFIRLEDKEYQSTGFGEVYFSSIYPNVIKAWHYHKEMVMNYACISGMIRLVLYDMRPGSTWGVVNEFYIGDDNYSLIHIPAKVWNGFRNVGEHTAVVANFGSVQHHPDEIVRTSHIDIPGFTWNIVPR